MQIAKDRVVVFDYTLRDEQGVIIDKGQGDEAMAYLHGQGQIVPGLEEALEGRTAGEDLVVLVSPEKAYGPKSAAELVRVPKEAFGDTEDLEIGEEVLAAGEDGEEQPFWIASIEDDAVVVSADHPLAGMTLRFEVSIREVREATAEELEHGHAHFGDEHEDDEEGEGYEDEDDEDDEDEDNEDDEDDEGGEGEADKGTGDKP